MAASPKEGESISQTISPFKRLKDDSESDGEPPEKKSLLDFEVGRILRESAREKNIFVEGKLCGQDAVIIMEKTPITPAVFPELLRTSTHDLKMKNDIYSTYQLQPPPHLNEIKTTLICPATDKHKGKYARQEMVLVEETEEDYKAITQPYIIKKALDLKWVNNILNKTSEADRIITEDPDPQFGFILLPDFKWDQKQLDDFHLIALAQRSDLKSLRDLTAEHLPLLRNIQQKGLEAIKQRYNIAPSKLRVMLHYQPTYYHLHVHFILLDYEAPGCGAERAHMLMDVIQNLQVNSDYYRKHTFTFPVPVNDTLLNMFKEAGRF